MNTVKTYKATCHCGAVEMKVTLPNGITAPSRCDCSYCRRRGTIVVETGLENMEIMKGAESLMLYQFHTETAQHYFCKICGINTHHKQRMNPNRFSINVGCLEGINPFDLGSVPTNDGINHPSDGDGS